MKCPLCGYDIIDEEFCTTCPVAGRKCSLSKCPKCGYTFAPDSAIINLFKKIFGSKTPADNKPVNRG